MVSEFNATFTPKANYSCKVHREAFIKCVKQSPGYAKLGQPFSACLQHLDDPEWMYASCKELLYTYQLCKSRKMNPHYRLRDPLGKHSMPTSEYDNRRRVAERDRQLETMKNAYLEKEQSAGVPISGDDSNSNKESVK